MKKRGFWILFSLILFFGGWTSFAASQILTYEEMLSLYFGVVSKEWNAQQKKPLLQYSNLKPSNPLYQLLQKAVAQQKFPNIEAPLPLWVPALESDLALLMKSNFDYDLDFTTGSQLSFDFLRTALQDFYAQRAKTDPIAVRNESTKTAISHQVYNLLKTNFIHKERLQNLEVPNYEDLASFVGKLQDPYAKYYAPYEWKNFMDSLKGSFGGVGIYLTYQEGKYPKVVKVIEGSPAQKAWIQVQDLLLAVNGNAFSQYQDFDAFVLAMKGAVGSQVKVQVKRENQILDFILKRDTIQLPLIQSKKLDKVCYLRIHSFDLGIKKKFSEALLKLAPCDTFVFDVRGNPGGVVDEVIGIVESFIPNEKPILTINSPEKQEIISSKNQHFFPFQKLTVILIDEATASAAEIFAGVLKHYYPEQVKLVGQKSYGKGSVQEVVEFVEHSLLKYTVALWNIADQKNSLNQKGLIPDLVLQDDPLTPQDEVLEKLGIKFWN